MLPRPIFSACSRVPFQSVVGWAAQKLSLIHIFVFSKLTQENIEQIAGNMLGELAGRLKNVGVQMAWTEAAVKQLASVGFDPVYGARPLRLSLIHI